MNSAELAENVSPLEQICPNGGFVFAQCTLQHQSIVAAGCCGSAPDLPAGGAVIYLRPSTLDLLSPSSCISAFQHLRDRGNGLLRYHAYSVERAAVSNRSSEGGAALIGCNQQYAWQLRLRPARAREVFQKLSLAVSRLEHTINTTARPRQLVASPLPVYDGGIGPPIFNASSEALYAQNFPAASGASAAAMRLAIFNVGQVNSITEYKFAFESFGCCQLRNWYEYLDRSLTVSGSASVMGSGALLPAANATVGPMRLGPTVGSTGVVPDISFYAGGNGQRAFLVEVFLTGSTAASLFVDGSGLSGRLDVGFLWTGRIVDSIEYNEISNAWSRPQTLVNTTSMLLSRPVLYPASGGASAALTVSGSGCGGISTTLCATLTVQPVLTLSVDNQMGWRTSPQVQATFMLDGRGGSNLPVCSGSPSGPGSTSAAWAFTGAAVSSGVAEMDMIDFDGLPINLTDGRQYMYNLGVTTPQPPFFNVNSSLVTCPSTACGGCAADFWSSDTSWSPSLSTNGGGAASLTTSMLAGIAVGIILGAALLAFIVIATVWAMYESRRRSKPLTTAVFFGDDAEAQENPMNVKHEPPPQVDGGRVSFGFATINPAHGVHAR